MTWLIFSLGIVLIVFSLGFFISAWRIKFEEVAATQIKEIWPRFSYVEPQLVTRSPTIKILLNILIIYIGNLISPTIPLPGFFYGKYLQV